MASAKQIAWRKKFAKMSKAGKFKKSTKRRDQFGKIKKIQRDETDIGQFKTGKLSKAQAEKWWKSLSKDEKASFLQKNWWENLSEKDKEWEYRHN